MIQIEKYPAWKIHTQKYRIWCNCGTVFTCDTTDLQQMVIGHGRIEEGILCPNCKEKHLVGFDNGKEEIIGEVHFSL